jgi:uncharacterized protein YeaO (DUF488 family)
MKIEIKRVYEKPAKEDGIRILVDRLAPSTELRKWFGHEPAKWIEFKKRYHQELKRNIEQVSRLKDELKKGTTTLVYGAKNVQHNEAVVLKELFRSL